MENDKDLEPGELAPFILSVLRKAHPRVLSIEGLIKRVCRKRNLPKNFQEQPHRKGDFIKLEFWRLANDGKVELTPTRKIKLGKQGKNA